MEIIIVKQTDAKLTEQDSAAVKRYLFDFIDGCNDKDKKAWRSWWKAVAESGSGEYFVISIGRKRHGSFHRLVFAVMQAVYKQQERFEDFKIFRAWVKIGSAFVEYLPDLTGALQAHPKSQSFDDCSEEEIRAFFDDMQAFFRTAVCHRTLWPHLSPEVAEQSMEAILSQFDRGMS